MSKSHVTRHKCEWPNVNDIHNGQQIQGELLSLQPAVDEIWEYLFLKRNAGKTKTTKRKKYFY